MFYLTYQGKYLLLLNLNIILKIVWLDIFLTTLSTNILTKQGYSIYSHLTKENKIFDFVNKIVATPFKINHDLLEILLNDNKLNLFLDPSTEHKFKNISRRSKYQDNIYKSHIYSIFT